MTELGKMLTTGSPRFATAADLMCVAPKLLAVLEAAQRFVVEGESADSAVAIRVAVAAAAADPLLAPTIGDDVIPNVGKP